MAQLILSFFPVALLLAANSLLSDAAAIAARRSTSIWASARPEAGGALILYLTAFVLAAMLGGWL